MNVYHLLQLRLQSTAQASPFFPGHFGEELVPVYQGLETG